MVNFRLSRPVSITLELMFGLLCRVSLLNANVSLGITADFLVAFQSLTVVRFVKMPAVMTGEISALSNRTRYISPKKHYNVAKDKSTDLYVAHSLRIKKNVKM